MNNVFIVIIKFIVKEMSRFQDLWYEQYFLKFELSLKTQDT